MDKCPMCGWSETPESKTFATVMSCYVDQATGKKAFIAKKDEKIEVRDEKDNVIRVWVREDLYKPTAAEPTPPAKTEKSVPPTPPPPPKLTAAEILAKSNS